MCFATITVSVNKGYQEKEVLDPIAIFPKDGIFTLSLIVAK